MSELMPRLLILSTLLAVFAAGCRQKDEIRHYTIAKQDEIDRLAGVETAADKSESPGGATAEAQRMLAAIVLRPSQAWFFKLLGSEQAVDMYADEFNQFLKSVHFADESTPDWSLPAGWTRQPGDQIRYATLAIEGTSLEVTVTTLGRGELDETDYVLSNVNRWRGQLGLDPIGPSELARETKEVSTEDGSATFVDFVGQGDTSSMSPPFAQRRPPAPSVGGGPAALKYEVPEGWQEQSASGFRKASFKIHDGGETGDVSVSDLDAAAGDLLPNVNRGRGQVGLEPTTQRDVEQHVEAIDVGTHEGQYIEMLGDAKATLGVIVKAAQRAWFIKLTGDRPLVEAQRDNFKTFVHSLVIGEEKGATDGN
jgi:hypothetical protein